MEIDSRLIREKSIPVAITLEHRCSRLELVCAMYTEDGKPKDFVVFSHSAYGYLDGTNTKLRDFDGSHMTYWKNLGSIEETLDRITEGCKARWPRDETTFEVAWMIDRSWAQAIDKMMERGK